MAVEIKVEINQAMRGELSRFAAEMSRAEAAGRNRAWTAYEVACRTLGYKPASKQRDPEDAAQKLLFANVNPEQWKDGGVLVKGGDTGETYLVNNPGWANHPVMLLRGRHCAVRMCVSMPGFPPSDFMLGMALRLQHDEGATLAQVGLIGDCSCGPCRGLLCKVGELALRGRSLVGVRLPGVPRRHSGQADVHGHA